MRVIGYVRDAPGPDNGTTLFGQSEAIRRWVTHNRCKLVAVCQDAQTGDETSERDGFRALLGIVATGQVDAVVIPSVNVLSPDLMVQEIMLWDLRHRGINVISADEADLAALSHPAISPARMLIRDVLEKQQRYRADVEPLDEPAPSGELDLDGDVLIELIPHPEAAAQAS